jgi:hypothetical protein
VPGLTRHLLAMSEIVIELDRPKRAARRNGAKSDPLDAIRAAREAMVKADEQPISADLDQRLIDLVLDPRLQ